MLMFLTWLGQPSISYLWEHVVRSVWRHGASTVQQKLQYVNMSYLTKVNVSVVIILLLPSKKYNYRFSSQTI
jgi:hypothetical protein